jgi:putative endonuclease
MARSRHEETLGKWGEGQAVDFLKRHGFNIVERNYFSPVGEIDVVARFQEDYYFVEVKTRQTGAMATDLAVTRAKKHKLDKTIKRYCYERGIGECGLVLAGLLVVVDPVKKIVQFRLAVFLGND